MKINPLPTQERLRELLSYDSATGVLIWKIDRAANCRAGTIAGTRCKKGLIVYVDRKPYRASRLIWVYLHGSLSPEMQVDHRNGDWFDNREGNLRLATHAQNASNSRLQNGKALPKGVSLQSRSGRYRARIGVEKGVVYLGTFDTAEEAHLAYRAAAVEHKAEFAKFG